MQPPECGLKSSKSLKYNHVWKQSYHSTVVNKFRNNNNKGDEAFHHQIRSSSHVSTIMVSIRERWSERRWHHLVLLYVYNLHLCTTHRWRGSSLLFISLYCIINWSTRYFNFSARSLWNCGFSAAVQVNLWTLTHWSSCQTAWLPLDILPWS